MCFQLQDTRNTRVIVDGEPGAGKTTFVKKLCQTWMQSLCQAASSKNLFQMVNFRIMLAIILRLVQPGFTLFDIIFNQMPFLTMSEVCAVLKLIYTEPNDLCIVLDGYDELRASDSDEIVKVLKGSIAPGAICITTTRPHGVGRIKRYSAKAVQEHIRLCGFSPEQIKIYIQLFFKKEFIAYEMEQIINSQPEFKELARIPIRLEMMCTVYGVKSSIGENLVQLYDKFIQCLLLHYERKKNLPLTPEKKLFEKYHSLLMSVAEFANFWDSLGQMRIVFDFEDLTKKFEDTQTIIDFGWITKYHPSSTLENSRWSFTHLSLHEYFVAYHLAHTESPNTTDFSRRCHTVRTLEKHTNIVKFLCTMNPSKANEVIGNAMKKVKSPDECKRLLDLTMQFILEYKSPSHIILPLPRKVLLRTLTGGKEEEENTQDSQQKKAMFQNMRILLNTDQRSDMRNMEVLHAYDMSLLPCVLNLDYVKDVEFIIRSKDDYGKAAEMLPGMLGMESLKLTVPQRFLKELDQSIPRTLSSFTIAGDHMIHHVPNLVKGMRKLKFLKVVHLGGRIAKSDVTQMSKAVQRCESVTDFQVVSAHSEPALVYLTARESCNLSLYTLDPESESSNLFIVSLTRLQPPPPLFALCMSNLDIEEHDESGEIGFLFGELLGSLVHLKILLLGSCGITAKVIGDIATSLENSGQPHSLRELDISGNEMEKCSDAMTRLLTWCPELLSLKATIIGEDLSKIRQKLKNKLKIQKLHLDSLNVSSKTKDLYMIFDNTPEIKELHLSRFESTSDYNETSHLQYILKPTKNSGLNQLQRLFITETDLSEDGIQYLSTILPDMKELQELHLPSCGCTDLDDVSAMVNNMPKSVKHLSLIGNDIEDLPFILNKSKEKLQSLKKLNIGKDGSDDSVTIIEEALGNVEVYYDESEVFTTQSDAVEFTVLAVMGMLDWTKKITQTATTYDADDVGFDIIEDDSDEYGSCEDLD